MKKGIVFLALFFWACFARAELFSGWTEEEKSWFALSEISQILDYQTTRNVLYQQPKSKGYYEINPLLSRHPNQGKLNIAEVVTVVGDYYLSNWLSHDNRLLWLQVHTGVELMIVGHNLSIGARIQF